jgi:hypothetical protein
VNPYAVKYSLGRAWGYAALSFGLWTFYWFHVNRRLLDGETGRGRDDALLHTLGLLVPVLNVFVVYWLYRDLDEVRRRTGLPGLPVGGYVVGAILAAPILYSIALGKLNEYWDMRTQGLASESPTTGGEKAVLIVGAAIWLLWILSMVLLLVLLIVAGVSSS